VGLNYQPNRVGLDYQVGIAHNRMVGQVVVETVLHLVRFYHLVLEGHQGQANLVVLSVLVHPVDICLRHHCRTYSFHSGLSGSR